MFEENSISAVYVYVWVVFTPCALELRKVR